MLGAGALGRPRGRVGGGRREEGSGWETCVYLWWIHVAIWQNQCNILKLKNNRKKIKINKLGNTSKVRVWQDWATSLSRIGEGNGNPLQCSCLENPRDWGAWWAAIYGVSQSQTRLKRLSSSSKVKVKSLSRVRLFATSWTDCTVHGILQAQNTGVGNLSLLQGIFPTQGLNPGLLHYRLILYQLSHKRSPRIIEWVSYPFSRGSSPSRNRTGVSYTAGRFFTNWAIWEALILVKYMPIGRKIITEYSLSITKSI